MDTVKQGYDILRAAEKQLHEAIKTALQAQEYSAVQELARLGDGLATLIDGRIGQISSAAAVPRQVIANAGQLATESPQPRLNKKSGSAAKKPSSPKGMRVSDGKGKYPYFKREGNRLVKVGWSKKNKEEYEHRVEKDAVRQICAHIERRVPSGELFDVESLGTIANAEHEEIPSYQIYLVIAWLRELCQISKNGRDGYVIDGGLSIDADFETLWEDTPAGGKRNG